MATFKDYLRTAQNKGKEPEKEVVNNYAVGNRVVLKAHSMSKPSRAFPMQDSDFACEGTIMKTFGLRNMKPFVRVRWDNGYEDPYNNDLLDYAERNELANNPNIAFKLQKINSDRYDYRKIAAKYPSEITEAAVEEFVEVATENLVVEIHIEDNIEATPLPDIDDAHFESIHSLEEEGQYPVLRHVPHDEDIVPDYGTALQGLAEDDHNITIDHNKTKSTMQEEFDNSLRKIILKDEDDDMPDDYFSG